MPEPAAPPLSGPRRRGPGAGLPRPRVRTASALVGVAIVLTLAAAPGTALADASNQPHTLCRLTDTRLPELSGLVVTGDKMLAMNDGGDRLTVYVLDSSCRVVDVRTAPVDPYDPEDLAVGADGTVWFSDTGDNLVKRPTVALLALHPDGSTSIYRLTYPDGPHDAEALLRAPDGTPYIVTKELLGNSGVYRPVSGLVAGGTVAMTKVADLRFTPTGTPGGPVGRVSQVLVTGGAVSADGTQIALRTYTDAYVWALTGSDVPKALAAEPVRIALPPAPQGEAISFAADSRQLVVAGEKLPGDVTVLPAATGLTPAAATTGAITTGAATPGATAPAAAAGGHAGVPTVTAGVIAAVTATLVVWITGKFRRRRP